MEHNPYHPPGPGGGWAGGPAPGGWPGGLGGSYEFSPFENHTIGSTGRRASLWGIVALISGVLVLGAMGAVLVLRGELVAQGLEPNWITIAVVAMAPFALVNLAIGGLYMGAGRALKQVVDTEGNDVEHMLQALDKLANAFRLEVIVSIVGVLLGFGLGFTMAFLQIDLDDVVESDATFDLPQPGEAQPEPVEEETP